jgi:hypothetical protein
MKPKQTKKTIVFLTLALMVGFFGLFVQNVQAADMTSEETIDLVNKTRVSQNMAELTVNEKLSQAAEKKIDDMLKNDYFAHTSPSGIAPWAWFTKVGYDYKFAGENLAINFSNAAEQQAAWMKSETHRKNILSPDYKEIGAAVRKGIINGKAVTLTVQEFGTQNIYVAADGGGKVAGAEQNLGIDLAAETSLQNSLWISRNLPMGIAAMAAIVLLIAAYIIKKRFEAIFLTPELLSISLAEYLKLLQAEKNNFGKTNIVYLGQSGFR